MAGNENIKALGSASVSISNACLPDIGISFEQNQMNMCSSDALLSGLRLSVAGLACLVLVCWCACIVRLVACLIACLVWFVCFVWFRLLQLVSNKKRALTGFGLFGYTGPSDPGLV